MAIEAPAWALSAGLGGVGAGGVPGVAQAASSASAAAQIAPRNAEVVAFTSGSSTP